jgi:hypothetical protein
VVRSLQAHPKRYVLNLNTSSIFRTLLHLFKRLSTTVLHIPKRKACISTLPPFIRRGSRTARRRHTLRTRPSCWPRAKARLQRRNSRSAARATLRCGRRPRSKSRNGIHLGAWAVLVGILNAVPWHRICLVPMWISTAVVLICNSRIMTIKYAVAGAST